FVQPANIVLPHTFINEVVEVKIFHVLELKPCGREQLFAHPDVWVHGAAHIKEDQHLYRIVALRHHFQIKIAGISRGGTYGVIHIQLVRSPLAGKLPQAPQRDLDVADAQRNAVVQILVFPFFPDFYRPPLTAVFLADAEPFRVVAIGAERRRSTGADPLVATGMTLILLFHALFEGFNQLFQATQRLDLGLLFFGQVFLELGSQPVIRYQSLEQILQILDTVEIRLEGAVEFVEVSFIFYEAHARQVIELLHVGKSQTLLDRFQQVQKLPQTGRHFRTADFEEKIDQHKAELLPEISFGDAP